MSNQLILNKKMWGSFKENFLGRLSSKEDHEIGSPQQMTKDAMKNVVTPQSIPQFIVPPLNPGELTTSECLDEGQKANCSATDGPDEDINKSPLEPPFQNISLKPNNSSPSINSKQRSTRNKPVDQQHQPGLSLQHLLSVKKGFSTLIESPNTRRKESLFLSPPISINDKPDYKKQDGIQGSSSDSDHSRNVSPITSPFEKLRSKRLLARSAYDSDSNSSRHSTPFSSPARQRKFTKKKSLEVYSTTDVGLSPPTRRSKFGENVKSPTSPSLSIRSIKEEFNHNTVERSFSASTLVADGSNEAGREGLSSSDCARVKIKLAYIPELEKINISIVEAENFFVGRPVYLKVALLPRYYGYQRTDSIKVTSASATLRERLTFDAIKENDIPQLSLEVSCKEKMGRLRTPNEVGKSIITLSEIDKKTSDEFWLELTPPELKENIHIQLTLCYDAVLGFVVADVIGVRNIPKGSLGRYPDSYVVLAEEPQCDKNKKKQTEIKYRSKDPTYNQSFVFSMSNDHLVIVATLFVKDKIKGGWTAKGEIKLGQDVAHWSGQTHWAQALSHAGTPVTLWHLLTPP